MRGEGVCRTDTHLVLLVEGLVALVQDVDVWVVERRVSIHRTVNVPQKLVPKGGRGRNTSSEHATTRTCVCVCVCVLGSHMFGARFEENSQWKMTARRLSFLGVSV